MELGLDKIMKAMTIEEDEPIIMPDLPEFKSTERNVLSIMGRLLNLDCQKISSLVLDMSRKWGMNNRVRGVVLSKDRFQFIFKYEEDLKDILNQVVHTYNEWSVVLDRWVDPFPEDYVKYLMVWVQIRNIRVNYHTEESIKYLGSLIGEVKETDFDPTKSRNRYFYRAHVLFDVSHPVRRAKVFQFPCGTSTNIFYDFEGIRKRCFICQRLTHENTKCPSKKQSNVVQAKEFLGNNDNMLIKPSSITVEKDPLVGVLLDSQLGINPSTGRPRIHPEIFHEMRQYLMIQDTTERKAREIRIQKQVNDLESEPCGKKEVFVIGNCPRNEHGNRQTKRYSPSR